MEARSDASKLEVVKQEMTRMNVYILRIRELKWTGMRATATAAKSLQSCLTLCDPIDGSLPGSPVPGILQARILELVAMSSSRRSSPPRNRSDTSYIYCIDQQVA